MYSKWEEVVKNNYCVNETCLKKIVVIHPKGAYSIKLSFVKGIKTRELVKVLRRNNADNKK